MQIIRNKEKNILPNPSVCGAWQSHIAARIQIRAVALTNCIADLYALKPREPKLPGLRSGKRRYY